MGGYVIHRPDEAAMRRILDANAVTPTGTILRLAWLQGLTREEISQLTWADVVFADQQLSLKGRQVPLCEEMAKCLAGRYELYRAKSPYVVISDKYKERLSPESISRLVRKALDREGMEQVRLMDLRHDFILRQLQSHDWPYVVRVSGMSVATLQSCFNRQMNEERGAAETIPEGEDAAIPAFAPVPAEETEASAAGERKPSVRTVQVDEFKLWKILQANTASAAGIALWLTWQLGLQGGEIVSLTWDQVDLEESRIHLPERSIPLTNSLRRILQAQWDRRQEGDPPQVLLSPNSRKPMDLARLSKLVRTTLIRGGMEQVTLRDLRKDESRESEESIILRQAAEAGSISRQEVMAFLGLSKTTAYHRLRGLTDRKKLVRVGEKYYVAGTVVPPERQWEEIARYLEQTGSAYRQDIAGLLRVGPRQCASLLRRMVDSGRLIQRGQRYFLSPQYSPEKNRG